MGQDHSNTYLHQYGGRSRDREAYRILDKKIYSLKIHLGRLFPVRDVDVDMKRDHPLHIEIAVMADAFYDAVLLLNPLQFSARPRRSRSHEAQFVNLPGSIPFLRYVLQVCLVNPLDMVVHKEHQQRMLQLAQDLILMPVLALQASEGMRHDATARQVFLDFLATARAVDRIIDRFLTKLHKKATKKTL